MTEGETFSAHKDGISIGLGTTANCNLNCGHCYSRPLRGESLTYGEMMKILQGKKIKSINFGTGENILNPDFTKMIDKCHEMGIKMSLTSNGYSIIVLPDEQLKKFNDLDISLDFSNEEKQNDFRKGKSWNFADEAIKKCQRLGIEFSITTALMNINYKEIPKLLERAKKENCNLRTNIFKPVPKANTWEYKLSYEQFWEAMEIFFTHGKLISCSEPIVNAILGITPIVPESPCGKESIRIHPDGEVMPCVYWMNSENPVTIPGGKVIPAEYWTKSKVHITDLNESFEPAFKNESFQKIRTVPKYCLENCDKVSVCGGGCASRRYLHGQLGEPDEYCPIYHKREIPKIEVTKSESMKDLVHSSYLCTLIFESK